jgi:hypothetical protein
MSEDIPKDLPPPSGLRLTLPKSAPAGWWKDPAQSHVFAVRYHDGNEWTDFVCVVVRTSIGPVERIPLGARDDE